MINLIMTGNEEDLQKLTGLDHKGLWDAGFNLDDWDACFVSDIPLHSRIESIHTSNWLGEEYDEVYYELDYDDPKREDVHWLFTQMNNYCVGFNYVEYNGKHYYTVHHS